MKEKIISDWRKVDLRDPDGQLKFKGAIQAYLFKPEKRRFRAQEYTTRSDFPQSAHDAVATFHEADDIDLGYERVFDIIDFTQSKKNSFDIITTGSGLTFAPVKPGEKAVVYKVVGEKITVNFERYGGALQWDKTWFDDEEYWNIDDATREFRNTWYNDRAQVFYDLVSKSRADSDISWQGGAEDSKAVRDAETINYACADIITSLKGKGMDVNPSTTFIVLAPMQIMARLQNALRITLLETGSEGSLNFNAELVVTTMLKNQALSSAETSQYFVCLPGRKAKGGYRQDLTLLAETDILAYAETVAAWGRYGGAAGEAEQFRRCATS